MAKNYVPILSLLLVSVVVVQADESRGMQVYVRNFSSRDAEIVPEKKGAETCSGQDFVNGKSYSLPAGESMYFWSGRTFSKLENKDCELKKFKIPSHNAEFSLVRSVGNSGNGYYIEITDQGVKNIPWHSSSEEMKPANGQDAVKWKNMVVVPEVNQYKGKRVTIYNYSDNVLKVLPDDSTKSCDGQSFAVGKKYNIAPYTALIFRSGVTESRSFGGGMDDCELRNLKLYDHNDAYITTIELRRDMMGGSHRVLFTRSPKGVPSILVKDEE